LDQQTLVTILTEIAELEELKMQAAHTVDQNAAFTRKMAELQAEYDEDAETAAGQEQNKARDLRSFEREMETVEYQLEDRREKMIGVTDRRQHQALKKEIAALELRLQELEESAMACLADEEKEGHRADQARRERDEQRERTAGEKEDRDQQSAALQERLAHIDTDLHRLLSMLPPLERKHVERLMEKLDRAVVTLQNGACTGCFHQLPTQEAINVGKGRMVVRCPSCRRYLVHASWK
jgi:predicted  nucleic acid-binding Zn-ribbon protein